MKLNLIRVVSIFMIIAAKFCAHPMIRKIENRTPFQYKVIAHNDMSDCSDFNNGKTVEINPLSTYENPLLLGFEKPGLLLRPVAYYDQYANEYYPLIDEHGEFDLQKIERAFEAWKKTGGIKYRKNIDKWISDWLCGDIFLIHNHVEVFGYLSNIALTRIDNDKNYHVCMIDFSEGLYSRLFIDITIGQKRNKGIIPYVRSFVGQGGFCQDGEIILLS